MGKFEQEHTLKLVFQHWNVEGSGKLSKCISETLLLVVQPCKSANKILLPERGGFQVENFLQISVWVWPNSEGFSLTHSLDRRTGSQGADARLLEIPKIAAGGSPGVGGSSKTFPDVPYKFRVSSWKQESRQAFHEDSEYS